MKTDSPSVANQLNPQPMPAAVNKANRYPGPEPFKDDKTDRLIFHGRDAEIAEVLNRLAFSKLLVLYAKSGLGKTSMLQAGLFQKLRDNNFLPIRLRFNHRDTNLLLELQQAVTKACRDQAVDFSPGEGDSYWEYFNTAIFSKGDQFLTPVLILDQFEEIFTLQSEQYRTQLGEQLGYLVSGQTPESVRARIRAGDKTLPTATPNVRLLISLREDSVGALHELAPYIPGILSQRIRLMPLNRELAHAAIVNPAQLHEDQGAFIARPFFYQPATVEALLDYLQDKHGNIEPFQLQLLCEHIQRQVILNQIKATEPILVDLQGYLGGKDGMDKVTKRFYSNAIQSLPGWWRRRKARNLCEIGLLNPDGRRESLSTSQILRSFSIKQGVLDQLVDKKVLRREERLDDFAYELSHDCLALAIFKSRQTKVKLKWLILFLTCTLLLGSAFLWQRQQTQSSEIIANANLDEYKQQVKEVVALDRPDAPTIKQPKMVFIPQGSFLRGSKSGHSDEMPISQVSIPAFSMSAYEVTFEEYDQYAASVEDALPSDNGWGRGKRPVINVSWFQAIAYAAWLSEKTGKRYRLPTEAEWEYAARANTTGDYHWGAGNSLDFAWFYQNSGRQSHPVGDKSANAFGLYDMGGNVWEWVQDCYAEDYKQAPRDGSAWESQDCQGRVLRGGSWFTIQDYLRSTFRLRNAQGNRDTDIGFRLAQD
jgi:formylglycine-generating enzyme required for sulfatase activity